MMRASAKYNEIQIILKEDLNLCNRSEIVPNKKESENQTLFYL
jgi:hypothetical protein